MRRGPGSLGSLSGIFGTSRNAALGPWTGTLEAVDARSGDERVKRCLDRKIQRFQCPGK